jgi:hypothetical protein
MLSYCGSLPVSDNYIYIYTYMYVHVCVYAYLRANLFISLSRGGDGVLLMWMMLAHARIFFTLSNMRFLRLTTQKFFSSFLPTFFPA